MSFGKFALVFLALVLLGLLQSTALLAIGGVKPNILLMFLIALAFFVEDLWQYIFFILVAGALLKTQGFFTPELLVFTVLALLAAWVAATWHAQPVINNIILAAAATLLFYLGTSPSYFVLHPGQLGIELVYNVVVSALLFNIFNQCLKTSSMLRT